MGDFEAIVSAVVVMRDHFEVSIGREALRLVIAASPKSLALLEPVLSDVLAAARCLDHELASRPEMEEGIFEILDAEFAPKP